METRTRRSSINPIRMARSKSKRKARSIEDDGTIHSEDEPEWEWTDGISDINPNPESTKSDAVRHYSASYDGTHYKVGDLVQIRGDSIKFRWVGLIRGFEYDTQPEHETLNERKRVIVLWFCRQSDIKSHKRKDAHIVILDQVGTTHEIGRNLHVGSRRWDYHWVDLETRDCICIAGTILEIQTESQSQESGL